MYVYSVEGLPGCGKTMFCNLLKQQMMLNNFVHFEDQVLVIQEPEDIVDSFSPFVSSQDDIAHLNLSYVFENIERDGLFYVIAKCIARLLHFRRQVGQYKAMHNGEEPVVVIVENYTSSFERHILLPYLIDEEGVTNGEALLFMTIFRSLNYMIGMTNTIVQTYSIFIDCSLHVLEQYRNVNRELDGRLPPHRMVQQLATYVGLLEMDASVVVRNTVPNVESLTRGVLDLLNDATFLSHFH